MIGFPRVLRCVRRELLFAIFTAVCTLLIGTPALAHPYHICVGQMAWNTQSQVWEVSLRLHPQDLERAMKQWRLASVEKTPTDKQLVEMQKGCSIDDPEFEKVIVEFLGGEFFFMTMPQGATAGKVKDLLSKAKPRPAESRIQWVGKESEKGWLWLHFEVVPPKPDGANPELWIVHKILIDVIEKQENSLAVQRTATDKFTLQFKKGDIAKRFVPERP